MHHTVTPHSSSSSHLLKYLTPNCLCSLTMDWHILDIPYKRSHSIIGPPYLQFLYSQSQPPAHLISVCSWLNLRMQTLGYGGLTINYMQIFNHWDAWHPSPWGIIQGSTTILSNVFINSFRPSKNRELLSYVNYLYAEKEGLVLSSL